MTTQSEDEPGFPASGFPTSGVRFRARAGRDTGPVWSPTNMVEASVPRARGDRRMTGDSPYPPYPYDSVPHDSAPHGSVPHDSAPHDSVPYAAAAYGSTPYDPAGDVEDPHGVHGLHGAREHHEPTPAFAHHFDARVWPGGPDPWRPADAWVVDEELSPRFGDRPTAPRSVVPPPFRVDGLLTPVFGTEPSRAFRAAGADGADEVTAPLSPVPGGAALVAYHLPPRRSRRGPREAPAAAPEPVPRPTRGTFDTVFALTMSLTVVLGLVYYFGRARGAAMADHLGVAQGMPTPPASEVLLDGFGVLRVPLLLVAGSVLGLRIGHPRLLLGLRRHRRSAGHLLRAMRLGWLLAPLAVCLLVALRPDPLAGWWPLLLPAALTLGVVAAAYGRVLSRQMGAHRRETGAGVRPGSPTVLLTGTVVTLSLVLVLGAYAHMSGRAAGERLASGSGHTSVVLYSTQDLRMFPGNGVAIEIDPASDFRYRYTGLHLIRRSGGALYLLPGRWSPEHPRLLVVREDAHVRIEYERTRSA